MPSTLYPSCRRAALRAKAKAKKRQGTVCSSTGGTALLLPSGRHRRTRVVAAESISPVMYHQTACTRLVAGHIKPALSDCRHDPCPVHRKMTSQGGNWCISKASKARQAQTCQPIVTLLLDILAKAWQASKLLPPVSAPPAS